MNISDSQRIKTKLDELGYESAPEKEADLVVVNACSVRQKGIDRIWGGIKRWRAQKKRIVITGCVLKDDKKKYLARDIEVLDIKDLKNISPGFFAGAQNDKSKENNDINLDYFNIKPSFDEKSKIAYIPIATGCDNFCSYCAVPYTRGREVSRPMEDILAEVNDALKKGFEEIWLLGQNVNSYQSKKLKVKSEKQNQNNDFIKLLNSVDNLPGDFKFNFISSNPQDMGDDLIDCFANLKKWNRELHLAMQSGDDEILRKMNRKCTSEQFLKLVSHLKLKIPASTAGGKNLKLSTDIIVGFPGETEEQFNNTLKACKEIGFWKAYVNQYSPRIGTVSAKMKDDVPAEDKKRRWKILDNLINKKASE